MAYTPTNWTAGDTITAEKLNKIEQGLFEAIDSTIILNNKVEPFIVTLTPTALDYSGEMDKTVAEINAAYVSGRKIVYKVAASETKFTYADVTMVYVDSNFTYPSFNAFIIDDGNDLLMEAATGATDDGDRNTYVVAIYPLTLMS